VGAIDDVALLVGPSTSLLRDYTMTTPERSTITDSAIRPREVSIATRLSVVSLALGVLSSVLLWRFMTSTAPVGFILTVQIFTFALLGWLIHKTWQGRNWARITLLVIVVLGLPFYVPNVRKFFAVSPTAGYVNVAQSILQVVALYLLFISPGRVWFNRRSPLA
jgi:hypothetical protein